MDVNKKDNVVDSGSSISLISSKYMTYLYTLITGTNLAGYQQFFHGTSRKPKISSLIMPTIVLRLFSKINKSLFFAMYSQQSGWNLADKATLYLLVKRVTNHWIRFPGVDRI